MRAMILLLSACVVGLAVLIVTYVDERPGIQNRVGELFYVGQLLEDGRAGESATYQETTSRRIMEFRLEQAPRLPPTNTPFKVIRRILRDPFGEIHDGPLASVAYDHRMTVHGWFPLMAPEAPDALDRVWIVREIRPDAVTVGRTEHDAWRVDLIDPALPPGSDTVVAWFSTDIPVYGLLRWKRLGETWEFRSGQRAPARSP